MSSDTSLDYYDRQRRHITSNPLPANVSEMILSFIDEYRSGHAYGPTYREIGAAVGIKGVADVHKLVHRLRARGLVEIDEGISRSIRRAS